MSTTFFDFWFSPANNIQPVLKRLLFINSRFVTQLATGSHEHPHPHRGPNSNSNSTRCHLFTLGVRSGPVEECPNINELAFVTHPQTDDKNIEKLCSPVSRTIKYKFVVFTPKASETKQMSARPWCRWCWSSMSMSMLMTRCWCPMAFLGLGLGGNSNSLENITVDYRWREWEWAHPKRFSAIQFWQRFQIKWEIHWNRSSGGNGKCISIRSPAAGFHYLF